MTNSDILKRIRYTFDYDDFKMIELFKLAGHDTNREEVCNWLKQEDDPEWEEITDKELATFLNGFIIEKRGKREGPLPKPEDPLTNNMILRKLKIALNLKAEQMLYIFSLANRRISKHELSAFFRNPNNKSYEPCMEQYLRNFLSGMQKKYKKEVDETES